MVTKMLSLTAPASLIEKLEQEDNMSALVVRLLEDYYAKPEHMTKEEREKKIKELQIRLKAAKEIESLGQS